MTGETISFYPSIAPPAPNDDKSLSFDYTPTFAEASEGMQDRFGTGQAGQVLSALHEKRNIESPFSRGQVSNPK